MDYRIYDPVLYPVFILANTGAILHANPAGLFWLSKMTNYLLSGVISDHVIFSGLSLDEVREATPLQRLPYRSLHFQLINRSLEGFCEISMMKLSGDLSTFNYALFVYDKSTIQESEAIAATTIASPKPHGPPDTELNTSPKGLDISESAPADVLSMDSFAGLVHADRTASIITKVNIFCADLKISLMGQTVWITDTWLEAVVKKVGLKNGFSCSLELSDLGGMGGFMTKSKVMQITSHVTDQLVRFEFEGLSALNKRNLDAYLTANAGR